jgi:hypothetical protein
MPSENWYWQHDADMLLKVRLQPRARADAVSGVHNGCLTLRIKAPPVDGKANRRLVEFLADKLGVARSRIAIVQGEHHRYKTIVVTGLAGSSHALEALIESGRGDSSQG